MKRWISFLVALVLAFSLCACGQSTQQEPAPAPEQQEPAPAPVSAEIPEGPQTRKIQLIRAAANGYSSIELSEDDTFLARAVLPDQESVVDHWELNGELTDSGGRLYSLAFDSTGVDLVEAYIRPMKNVTCRNCYLQFLDDKGAPAGTKYKRVFFEEYYTVPTTNEPHEGGSISACVTAFVPAGKSVDYWIINGAAYHTEQEIRSFIFIGLTDSLDIDVVFKDGPAGTPVNILIGQYDPGNGRGTPVQRPDDDNPYGHEDGLIPPVWQDFGDDVDGETFDDETPTELDTNGGDHTHVWELSGPGSYEPTCTSAGCHHFVCKICGKTYDEYYGGGHQFRWVSDGPGAFSWGISGTHTQVCTVCGARGSTEAHAVERYPADGHFWCSVCGESWYEIN